MDGIIGFITPVAYARTPKNWAPCNGQTMQINTNQALFSILGVAFGGNGSTTFMLPNMQGVTPVGTGTPKNGGPTLNQGQAQGSPTARLTVDNLPPHTHSGAVSVSPMAGNSADEGSPNGRYPGAINNGYSSSPDANAVMQAPTVTDFAINNAGSSMPFNAMMPYLAINYIICIAGIYPSRS